MDTSSVANRNVETAHGAEASNEKDIVSLDRSSCKPDMAKLAFFKLTAFLIVAVCVNCCVGGNGRGGTACCAAC